MQDYEVPLIQLHDPTGQVNAKEISSSNSLKSARHKFTHVNTDLINGSATPLAIAYCNSISLYFGSSRKMDTRLGEETQRPTYMNSQIPYRILVKSMADPHGGNIHRLTFDHPHYVIQVANTRAYNVVVVGPGESSWT